MRPWLTGLLVASAVLAGCTRHQGLDGETRWDDVARYDYFVQREQRYSPRDWPVELFADFYIPRSFGQLPAVLLVHGGGWSDGERDDLAYLAGRLAESGFVAVTVDYRLAPAARHPAQVRDLAQALAYVKRRADSYQVDASRIAAWGVDAGATLALLLAAGGAGEGLPAAGGLAAVVAGAGAYDLNHWDGGEDLRNWLGRVDETAARRASPMRWIDGTHPPTFLYHGTLDRYVPVQQARDLRTRLAANGVPVELFEVTGLGHAALFLINRTAIESGIDFLRRRVLMGERR